MTTANILFRSSIARTSFTVISIIIAFFMTPFVIGKLGDGWYGVWTIICSVIGYYYLVDFGLATAVSRFVTQYITKKDYRNANNIINTSLVIYSLMALAICVLTAFTAYFAHYFIQNSTDLNLIRGVILILGLNFALEFPYKTFAGIIGAYARYDLITYSRFFSLVFITGFTVYFLNKGYGLLALSLIGLISAQISNQIFFLIAKRLFPQMRLGRAYFTKERVRELFSYGAWSFVIDMSNQIRFKLDTIVIAWAMTASHVTHYVIGARLAQYFLELVFRATNILTPVFTKYHALNNYEEIRNKLLFITKINTILAVFGGGLIIIVGRPFISRWMGNDYLDAYPVLVVLMLAVIIEAIHNPSTNVLYAISKHRFLAIVAVVEGILNLVISIILIHSLGILGVALGTAIPLTVSRLFVVPLYVCRSIELPINKYYSKIFYIVIFTISYLGVFYMFSGNTLNAAQYHTIFLVAVSAVPIYAFTIFFSAFDKAEREMILRVLPFRKIRIFGTNISEKNI